MSVQTAVTKYGSIQVTVEVYDSPKIGGNPTTRSAIFVPSSFLVRTVNFLKKMSFYYVAF